MHNGKTCKNELESDRADYATAEHLLESGQSAEGIALLEHLAQKQSTYWKVYNELAIWHSNQGDTLVAVPYFHKGISLEGKSGSSARNYATVLAMTGNMEGALAVLGEILHDQPYDNDVLAVIRDILSGMNPIPPHVWQRLVYDLRRGLHANPAVSSQKAIAPTSKPAIPTAWCPVCGNKQASFAPLPEFYREQSRRHGFAHFGKGEMISLNAYTCTTCNASDRERLYALWVDQQFDKKSFSRNMRVIHFAPEEALSKKLKKLGFTEYRTADLLMKGVDHQVDMMNMPFDDESFDFFICSHVLEHVESDDQAIRELYRITKPGGRGILVAPIITGLEKTVEDPGVKDAAGRWRLYGQDDHVRLYAHDDYVNKICSHGFRVEELGENYFSGEVFRSLGLTQTSILYVVSK